MKLWTKLSIKHIEEESGSSVPETAKAGNPHIQEKKSTSSSLTLHKINSNVDFVHKS